MIVKKKNLIFMILAHNVKNILSNCKKILTYKVLFVIIYYVITLELTAFKIIYK